MKLGLKFLLLLLAFITCSGLYAQNNSTYSQLIEEADLYLKVGDTGFARIDYEKAVAMNPSDEYPRLKVAEIDRKASSQRHNDSIFEMRLLNAEKYFKSGNYNLAQIEYMRSLELKPESVFIKGRLDLISKSVSKTDLSNSQNTSESLNTEVAKSVQPYETTKPGKKTNKQVKTSEKKGDSSKQEVLADESMSSKKLPADLMSSQKKTDSLKQEILADKSISPIQPAITTDKSPKPFSTSTNTSGNKAVQSKQDILADKSISSNQPISTPDKSSQQLAASTYTLDKKAVPSKQESLADKSISTNTSESKAVPSTQETLKDKSISTKQLPSVPTPLQEALSQADEFIVEKDYENAAQRYQFALSLKPSDKIIKSKLTTTRTILDKQRKDQKNLNDIILAAEKAATLNNTQQAITYYQQAALIKPDDVALQNKLSALMDKFNVEQNLDKEFKNILDKADKELLANNIPEAKKGYEQARAIKPDDKYTQSKLLEINKIGALAEAARSEKYKETLVLAESLLTQEDFQGAFQAFNKAAELQPSETYPKQKIAELSIKIKALEAQYKIAYSGYISEADKAFQLKNWDIAMDNYLQALKAKTNDTVAGNQIMKIVSYMDQKLVTTLTPPSPTILEGKEVKMSFKPIESAKRRNQFLVVRVKNSSAGNPRLYINYGQDAQKNGGIIYRNFLKGGQFVNYVVRVANQDRWYRLDNNWVSFTVEGGSVEIDNIKICADF